MTEIKSTFFCSRSKLKNVLEYTGFGFAKSGFTPLGFGIIHHFLPLRMKFLSESFVAIDKNKIQGLITLEKDEKSSRRLKITRLFLEKNSYDVGKLLVQYVLSRYCAMGAISYQVVVEDNRDDMLSLFIDGCGFRKNAQEYLYKIENTDINYDENLNPEGFKFYKNNRASDVCRLYNMNINSYQRHSFSRSREQFNPEFAQGINDKVSHSYLLEDEQKGKVYGYFNVSTYNNTDYVMDFVLDAAFEIYFNDALRFIAYSLNKRTKKWNLYVKVKSFFANYETFRQYLESAGYPLTKSSCILTKDYLKEIKESSLLNTAKIVFNDITPAYKNTSAKNGF